MWGWNHQKWRKKKGTAKCNKSTVKCDISIAKYDNRTIKREEKKKPPNVIKE